MDENIIKYLQRLNSQSEFLCQRVRTFNLGHSDQLCESFIHWINRDAGRFEAVPVLKSWDVRLVGDATEQETIGRFAVF